MTGDDLLGFAGISPAQVLAIPKPQQFAEKLHAYTRPWTDRVNMRTKDLVDLVLMIETHGVAPAEIAVAVGATFAKRTTHTIPRELPDPPAIWAHEFAVLAAEAQLAASTLPAAIASLRGFWQQVIELGQF